MDEKKVREAIERIHKMRDAYNATLRSLPQKTRERSDYNNYVDAFLVAIEALEKQLPKKVENWNGVSNMEEIRVGDIVMCVEYPGNPCGIVVKQYRPTACGQQTMIKCNDGRLFHAPTSDFRKIRRLE